MSNASPSPTAFRCPVQPENASATLKVGGRKVAVKLVDTSVEGFTITVNRRNVTKMRHGCKWTLIANGEMTVVHPEWMFNASNGDAQFGLRRLEDITPTELSKLNRTTLPSIQHQGGLSGPALAAMILLIIALIALPGVGDDLGTAPLIRAAIRDGLADVSVAVRRFFTF